MLVQTGLNENLSNEVKNTLFRGFFPIKKRTNFNIINIKYHAMKNLFTLLLLFLVPMCIYGQEELELDLNLIKPGKEITLSKGENLKYEKIKLVNKVPAYRYKIWFEKQTSFINPIPLSKGFLSNINESLIDSCNDLIKDLVKMEQNKELKESDIPNIKKKYEEQLKKCQNEFSMDDFIQMFEQEKKMNVEVKTGEILKIYVARVEGEVTDDDESIWTFILEGKEPGKWVTTYGFGFTPQNNLFSNENHTFFTQQVPDSTFYNIKRSRDPSLIDLNYVPAIFFSYIPSQNYNKTWNHSATGGLGIDLEAPVVFIGYNLLFRTNLGISLGAAFQQQNRLKPQYSEGQRVSMNLDENQLHDRVYRPNLFIAVNFRLGESPFKGKGETSED